MTKQRLAQPKKILMLAAITMLSPARDVCHAQTASQGTSTAGSPAKIFLNFDEVGTTADPSQLIDTLKERFKNRVAQRAYRFGFERRVDLPEYERIERTVFISAHPAAKVSEVIKLIAIVKRTDASPVQMPIEVEPAAVRRLRLKSDWFIGPTFKPHPLTLVASLNQPDGFIDKPITGGIDVSLLGPMVGVDGSKVKDKTLLVIKIQKDGTYTLDDTSVAKAQLEPAIRRLLKTALSPDRALLINADSNMTYASVIDVAYAAKAAGVSLVFLPIRAQRIEWQEQGISFVLPEYWTKDWSEQSSQRWKGTDAQFSIDFGERLEDSVPQREFQELYDRQLQTSTGKPFGITRFVEVDGVKGLVC